MREETSDTQRSRDAATLRAAYGREGCPVCLVMLEYMEHAMGGWEFEGFTDMEHRHQLIRSRGFCPLHTWQLAQRNNAFQLALVYNEVLTDVLQELDLDGSNPSTGGSVPKRGPIMNRIWRKRATRTMCALHSRTARSARVATTPRSDSSPRSYNF